MAIICIAMPIGFVDEGNQFASCIGVGPDDVKTFTHTPNAKDAEGNEYIFTSGWVVDHFADIATGELEEPSWGCDLEAAKTIQSMIRVNEPASPETVSAMFTDDIAGAMAFMGLEFFTPVVDEE